VGEADFCFVTHSRDIESDISARPLGLILGEIDIAFQNMPNDSSTRNQFCYLLLAAMDVIVTVRKLITEAVGVTFNFSRPPSTNVIDRSEGLFWGLVYRKRDGEAMILSSFVGFANLCPSCCSCRVVRRLEQRRILALERLGRAAAPALSHGLRHGIGEDVLLPVLHSVEDGSCHGPRRGLRDVEASGHIGVHGPGQDGMNAHAPSGKEGTQRLRQRERGSLEIE
jgi:hypothetical protein